MSPFRPSLIKPPALHPANNRFLTPLFSSSSELLFSQVLCLHNHLRCPLVFSNRASLQEPSGLAASAKFFIYRFLAPSEAKGYADSPANSFIYCFYAKRPGGGWYPLSKFGPVPSVCPLPLCSRFLLFILLQTLCRSPKTQLLCNQANPNSLCKTPGVWGMSAKSQRALRLCVIVARRFSGLFRQSQPQPLARSP